MITCGGTIAKTYSESEAVLENVKPMVEKIVDQLRLPNVQVSYNHLMHKDSLDMDDKDRNAVVQCIKEAMRHSHLDGIIVIQGTDTLPNTGEAIYDAFPNAKLPIVLTGAMKPFVIQGSDALQNIAESIFSIHFLNSGTHVVMHGNICHLPGVTKNRSTLTFENSEEKRQKAELKNGIHKKWLAGFNQYNKDKSLSC